MKTIFTRAVSLGVIAAAVLGLAFAARGEKAPSEPNAAKTVELNERELDEQAGNRLRAKWAEHFKMRATLQSAKARQLVQPNVLVDTEVEKEAERMVQQHQRT